MTQQSFYRPFGAFRFLLAVLVVISHLQALFLSKTQIDFLNPLALGTIGVYLFFVVSGFVITEALLVFYRHRPMAFLANRFLRLYPPFLFALVFSIAIHYWIYKTERAAVNVGDYQDLGPFFSLSVIAKNLVSLFDYNIVLAQEKYYLFVRYVWAIVSEWQFYVLAAIASGFFWSKRNVRGAILIALALSIAVIPWNILFSFIQFSSFFLLGCAMCGICVLKKQTSDFKLRGLKIISAILAAVSIFTHTMKAPQRTMTSEIIASCLYIGLLLCFYFLAISDSTISSKSKKIDSFLGNLTYPLYLNHYVVECIFFALALPPSEFTFSLGILTSVIFSILAYYLVEPRIKKIRNRLRGHDL